MSFTVRDLKDPDALIALGFGSGLSPRAPGTVGTLAAIPLFLLLAQLPWYVYLLAVAAALGLGVWVCDRVAARKKVKDPGAIVWDEFVGLWIGLFLLPAGWWWLLAGFVLFRIFDIAKPWPVSWADRSLSGGLGIMMDDVVAGLYTLCVLQGFAYFFSY